MNEINKTLYIPLYGKAQVSKKGIIIKDIKAEEIWEKEQFIIKGKSKSKWLAYFMAMRARVFDEWVKKQLNYNPQSLVLHIGCGMDSRILRVGSYSNCWYDIDFPDVIDERKKYYSENERYFMLSADASKADWIDKLPKYSQAIVVLEGISMYLKNQEVANLFVALQKRFEKVSVLMDVYTTFGAKATKYKNPINDVGVTKVYGVDHGEFVVVNDGIKFIKEHAMTPASLVNELKGFDKFFFSSIFAGNIASKIYRLYEYRIENR
ncbi:MAG: class I SAM-dependent methyltransferase [Lachnospiraceae bacterium]|nr:class I SAM-dependent methyltransferase [Lachnospiraceae bacterium]